MANSVPLPDDISYAPLGVAGGRYTLPRRRLGKLHLLGLFLTLFGLFFAAIPAFGCGVVVLQMVRQGRFEPVELVIALFALPFMAIGIAIFGVGRFVAAGHAEIEVDDTYLRVRERAGIFRWTRKIPSDAIGALKVIRSRNQLAHTPFAALAADTGRPRPRLLTAGYPDALLEPLARDLSEHLKIDGTPPDVLVEDLDTADEWDDETTTDGEAAAAAPVPQPEWSKTKVERFEGGGVTLNVPPAGLVRGSKGLFLFALFWLALCIGGCGIFLASAAGAGGIWTAIPMIILFMAIFVCIGIGLLVVAINMGTRRVAFAVFDGNLMLMTKGIFGTKKMEWTSDEIDSVRVGPSGMTVNDQPVLNLQIHAGGGTTGLLAGHPDDELEWLADEIRRALQVTRQ